MMQGLNPGRGRKFLFSKMSRMAVGHIQSPVQCVLGVISPGLKLQGMRLTTYFF